MVDDITRLTSDYVKIDCFYKISLMLASNLPWLLAASRSFGHCTRVTGAQPATQFPHGLSKKADYRLL